MQQAVEQALDLAEYAIATAQQRPPKRKYLSSGEMSLQEKLYDIYVEECEEEPGVTEELRSNVNLLEKLLRRESLPCLVINLYPGKKGYSLMLKGENGSFSESIPLPYEEREFLEYLDAEELPPVLLNFLEKSAVNVFHQGCVLTEIRDYRQSSTGEPPRYQSRHILLRPTMQTLVCDVEAIASDDQNWTQEDKLLLESQLILATAEPLCLDPSLSVACTANRLLYNKQKLNTLPMKRNLKRFSVPALNRQQELSHCPPPPELRILNFCKKIRQSKANQLYDLKISNAGKCVDTWKQRPCDLAVPSQVDVQKYAKGKKSVRYEGSQPTQEVLDDSAVGCEAAYQSQATRLIVRQPTDNSLATGNGSEKKATWEREPCLPQSSTDDHFKSFLPRPQTDAGRVVSQSKQLVQESAESPVQMAPSSSGSAHLRQPSPGTQPAQPRAASVQSSVPNWAVRPPSPLKRRPGNSEKSSCSDSFTSQQAGSSQARPSLGPVLQPPSLSRRSSVQLNRDSSLPAAAASTTGTLQRTSDVQVKTITPGLKVIRVVGPFRCSQASGRGCAPRAPAPVGIQPGQRPAAQPLNLQPTAPQGLRQPASPPPPPPGTVQVLLKNTSDARPFPRGVQVPQGSVVWSSQEWVLQQCRQQLLPQQPSPQPCPVNHRQPGEQPSGTQGPGAQASGPQTTQAQASGPQCLGSQASGAQTPQVQTSEPQTPRAQASGPQTPGAQTPRAQASGPQTPGAQTPRAQASGPQTPGAQTPGAQASGPQTPGAQTPRAQASGPQTPGAQTPGAQASGPQTPGAQASGPQAPRAQTTWAQASGPQTPGAQAPGAQASGAQAPGAQTPGAQASRAQAPGAQTPVAQASGPQAPGPPASGPQCLSLQAPGAQGAARPNVTVHAQPTMVIHLRRQQDSLQPQVPRLSLPGSGQSHRTLRILHHRIQASQAPRSPIYWRVVQCPVAAAPTAPTAPPPQGPSSGSQTTGTPEGAPPAAPKP